MQRIRLDDTTSALCEIPFTTVSNANLQTRLDGTALPNANITVKVKQGNVGTAVSGAGSFVTVDNTNAPGVRGYRPSAGERVLGICTFVFTGTNGGNTMEPREVPVMFTADDPYGPAYFGAVVTGTLTTTAVSLDRTETTTDAWKDALIEFRSGPNAGSVRKITAYNGTTKVVTLNDALPATPTNGDKYKLITR